MTDKKQMQKDEEQSSPFVPSEEVGNGPGLDPPAEEGKDDTPKGDEAFANRPSRRVESGGDAGTAGTQGAANQRPPADS